MMQDMQGAMKHLREHQKYPATRAELIAACNGLDHFSTEDKKWFMDNLPEGTYKSADEVADALNMSM